jgi:hypothetical protein
MNAAVGWALAATAVAVAWLQWGWQGVVLAITVVVFWLLLQFSRSLRVLRLAGQAPVGRVPSAVMLHARLKKGMRLIEILPITRSLGEAAGSEPEASEAYIWRDESGAAVRVELVGGRCTRWELLRESAAPETTNPAEAGLQ